MGAGQKYRQRKKQAPCREPDVGLDPGTPGPLHFNPGPKPGAKPLSHPGIPPFSGLDYQVVIGCVQIFTKHLE